MDVGLGVEAYTLPIFVSSLTLHVVGPRRKAWELKAKLCAAEPFYNDKRNTLTVVIESALDDFRRSNAEKVVVLCQVEVKVILDRHSKTVKNLHMPTSRENIEAVGAKATADAQKDYSNSLKERFGDFDEFNLQGKTIKNRMGKVIAAAVDANNAQIQEKVGGFAPSMRLH